MAFAFCGFSLVSNSLNGLRSISPSLTALLSAAARRLTKMRQVVLPSVFFPLLKVQVFRKAMKPLQKSLSTSVRARSGLPICNRYCSTLACALRLERILAGERPQSSVAHCSTHALSVIFDFFTSSQFTIPCCWMSSMRCALICSASLRVFAFCNLAAELISGTR